MHPAITNQKTAVIDGNEHPTLDCTDSEDMTRQEWKHEADINTIVNRFGLTGQIALRQPVFGERDFDLDLHTGYLAQAEAQRGFLSLPRALRAKYRNPRGLLDAIHKNTFKADLEETLTAPQGAPPPAPPIVPPTP